MTCGWEDGEWCYKLTIVMRLIKGLVVTIAVLCIWSLVLWSFTNQAHAYNEESKCQERHDAHVKDSSKPWVIRLNTNVPFVWRCLYKTVDGNDANLTTWVPKLIQSLIRIVMTVVIVTWFLWILVWWFMITGAWAFWTAEQWKKIIIWVIVWLVLLWASWIILSLVNPDFFTLWAAE